MMKKLLLITTLSLMLSGCIIDVGDVSFAVQGGLKNTGAEQKRNCTFYIFQDDFKSPMHVEFTDSFELDFSVASATAFSRPEPVFFSITCEDGSYYTSPIYMLGNGSYSKFPRGIIDLGKIELKPK